MAIPTLFKEESMTERQLRKEGLLLRKHGDGYMIIDGSRNWVIAGGDGNGYILTFDKTSECAHSTSEAAM